MRWAQAGDVLLLPTLADPCDEALEWFARQPSPEVALAKCTRADWAWWYLGSVGHPLLGEAFAKVVQRTEFYAVDFYVVAARAATRAAAANVAVADAAAAARPAARAAYTARLALGAARVALHIDAYGLGADVAELIEHRHLCGWLRARLATKPAP